MLHFFILKLLGNVSYSKCLCYNTDGLEPGDVALSSTPSGYVQVFLSGVLAPVANSNLSWTGDNSEVVCRELGYSPQFNGK